MILQVKVKVVYELDDFLLVRSLNPSRLQRNIMKDIADILGADFDNYCAELNPDRDSRTITVEIEKLEKWE